jgi:hypothetical protein
MSLMVVAALMMAQAPAAAAPTPAPPAAAKKPKTQQVCEYIELTGSRSKRRVCRDSEGNLDLGPGISDSGFGKDRSTQPTIRSGGPGGAN